MSEAQKGSLMRFLAKLGAGVLNHEHAEARVSGFAGVCATADAAVRPQTTGELTPRL